MNTDSLSCEFCIKLCGNTKKGVNRRWYDFNIVLETDKFVLVPALGSLVPGYFILVSKRHVPSMGHLDNSELVDLHNFSQVVRNLQKKYWNNSIIFEHGGCSDNQFSTAGSCIMHAHWHMVPGNWDLMPSDINFTKIKSFDDFVGSYSKKSGYLFFERNDQGHIAEVNNVKSQLFRRELAQKIEKNNEWDYIAFPFLENIQETIETVSRDPLINNGETMLTVTREAYNFTAGTFSYSENTLPYPSYLKFANSFIAQLENTIILDAGAGSCRDAKYFNSRGLQVEAVDIAENLLNLSGYVYPNFNKRVMDIRSLEYGNDVFDGIWCSAALLHLNFEDIARTLSEFFRVLKRGGILYISLKEGTGEYKDFVNNNPELYRKFFLYSEAEIIVMLNKANFSLKSIETVRETNSNENLVSWIKCFAIKNIE